ncbi:hypothetical protein NFI96_025228 [Prochilodus magdalenae]|nr:hypothetical protein NFI96_025228 [Prochilodus magdalenae]
MGTSSASDCTDCHGVAQNGKRVIFSDESRFSLGGDAQRIRVCCHTSRRPGVTPPPPLPHKLCADIQAAWDGLSQDTIRNLYSSMLRHNERQPRAPMWTHDTQTWRPPAGNQCCSCAWVLTTILFFCPIGNICRSPIAEAVFRKMATDSGVVDKWRIDSAATSTYEIGNPPDYRGQACMKKHGVPMRHVARQWVIDSGATSDWNIGSLPDARGLACLRRHGIETDHRARQVTKEDFASFDYILCMDESNLRDLNRKANSVKNCKAKVELLGSYDPEKELIIQDPYYGSDKDFETVYEQCIRCCKVFLEKNS